MKIAAKSTKTIKPSTLTISKSKKDSVTIPVKQIWLEDYKDFYTQQKKPATQSLINRIGAEIVEWAKTTEMLKIGWFFSERNMDTQLGESWSKKYPDFASNYNQAKRIIGMRRECGGLQKKLDAGLVTFTMPLYDPEWRELLEWKAKMQKDNENVIDGKIVYNINMPTFGSSDMVPIKKLDAKE